PGGPARARSAGRGAVRLLPPEPARPRAVAAAGRRPYRRFVADAACALPPDRPEFWPLAARPAAAGLQRGAARPAAAAAQCFRDRLCLGLQRSLLLQPGVPPALRHDAARLAPGRALAPHYPRTSAAPPRRAAAASSTMRSMTSRAPGMSRTMST